MVKNYLHAKWSFMVLSLLRSSHPCFDVTYSAVQFGDATSFTGDLAAVSDEPFLLLEARMLRS